MSRSVWFGLGLQALAFALTWLFTRTLYAIAWLPSILISVPVFVAGMVVITRSGAPLAARIVLGYWPFLIGAGRIAVYVVRSRAVRAEVYLLPEGAHGEVNLLTGRTDGEPLVIEGGKVVLRIGKDGNLATRYEVRMDHGSLDQKRYRLQEFYRVDGKGTRTRIPNPEGIDLDAMTDTDVRVFSFGTEYDKEGRVTRTQFFVGTKAEYRAWVAAK